MINKKDKEKILKKIEELDREPILTTTPKNPCNCNFENGGIIVLENGKHKDCGKELNMMTPIKTLKDKITEYIKSL